MVSLSRHLHNVTQLHYMEVSVSVVARSSRSHILLNNDLALMVPFKPVSPPKLSLYDKANGKVVESARYPKINIEDDWGLI